MSEDNLSPYQQVGEKLIKAGICALPVVPGTKVPGKYTGGYWARMQEWTKRYSSALPHSLEIRSFNSAPNAGVCAVLGQASGYLVAVDVDVDEAVGAVTRALPDTPFRKKGQKGVTMFFRSKIPSRKFDRVNPDGTRERLVDFLAEGRQTVLPPTVHPDTHKPYRWVGELNMEDAKIESAPWLPEDAIERIERALEGFGYKKEAEPAQRPNFEESGEVEHTEDAGITVFRELNNLALERLDAWVPDLPLYKLTRTPAGYEAVADWRESCTGRPLYQRKLNLKISRKGITDFGESKGYTPIDLVAAANLTDWQGAFEWLNNKLGKSPNEFIGADLIPSINSELNEELNEELIENNNSINSDIKPWRREAIPEQEKATAIVEAPKEAHGSQDIDITQCPGLVGEIASWIVSTAEYQQPLLSIGSALALVGVVCSRQIIGPTQAGTHLYIAGVAPTGAGKDWPLTAITKILDASGMVGLIGPGRFTADSAITFALSNHARVVACIDEIGQFLSRGKSRSASTHEAGISALLRTLWGAGHGLVKMTGRANAEAIPLYSPALTIFGVTTAGELFDNMKKEDIHNGLLNRFLILKNDVRPAPSHPEVMRHEIPANVIAGLQAIKERLGTLADSQFSGAGTNPLTAEPHRVPWESPAVDKAFRDMRKAITDEIDANPKKEPFLARAAEMAVRIATIRAVGINCAAPSVTIDDLKWGEAIVRDSVDSMFGEAEDKIVDSEFERRQNRVMKYLARAEIKGGVAAPKTFRDIHNFIGHGADKKDISAILNNLIDLGMVEKSSSVDPKKDTAKTVKYTLTAPAKKELKAKARAL